MVQGAFPRKKASLFILSLGMDKASYRGIGNERRFSAFLTEIFKRLNVSIQGDLCRGMTLNVETK